jgi:hypothetical protein
MPVRVVVHIHNQDPFVADIDEMPGPMATNITLTNPRTRDQRPVAWITERVRALVFPLAHITFLEVVITKRDEEEVEPFFRNQIKGV